MFPNTKPLKENKNEQVGPFGYYHCFKQKHLTPSKLRSNVIIRNIRKMESVMERHCKFKKSPKSKI